jgi:uridine kinase
MPTRQFWAIARAGIPDYKVDDRNKNGNEYITKSNVVVIDGIYAV